MTDDIREEPTDTTEDDGDEPGDFPEVFEDEVKPEDL